MAEILVVGSLAYDEVQTPFEHRREVLGGAASYFSLSASLFAPVRIAGVVGDDFREDDLARFRRKRIDTSAIERRSGRSFHWFGRYAYDMSTAETLNTDLGVFEHWRPRLPDQHRDVGLVFLANIHPAIQLELLDQMRRPALVALDTMNYWIEHERATLESVISRVDVVTVNEAEARQLCVTFSILRAARRILDMGPRALIVKRGEHGAILFLKSGSTFWCPAYPLEKVQDPTGAGDSFAGGFLGSLAASGRLDDDALRRAVVHGTVCASFAVESFSVDAVEAATAAAIEDRYRTLRSLVAIGAETLAEASPPTGG